MTMDELCGMTAKVAVGANARFLARLQGVRQGLAPQETSALARQVSTALGRRDPGLTEKLLPSLVGGTKRVQSLYSPDRVVPRWDFGDGGGHDPFTALSRAAKAEPAAAKELTAVLSRKFPPPPSPPRSGAWDIEDIRYRGPTRPLIGKLPPSVDAYVSRKRELLVGHSADSADALAASGRHGPVTPLPGWDGRSSGRLADTAAAIFNPRVAYKGGGGAGDNPANRLAMTEALPGDAMWVSGYPFVSGGYAAGTGHVSQFRTADLAAAGPHSPRFTPHIAVDGRYRPGLLSRLRGKILPRSQPPIAANTEGGAAAAGGNAEWGKLPNYEAVFTTPTRPLAELAEKTWKSLPSGRGFQAVADKPLPAGRPS